MLANLTAMVSKEDGSRASAEQGENVEFQLLNTLIGIVEIIAKKNCIINKCILSL